MEDKARKILQDAMKLKNELFTKEIVQGSLNESERLIFDFVNLIEEEYIKLDDKLHVPKPSILYFGRGELNGE